jgi:hypothetical protein
MVRSHSDQLFVTAAVDNISIYALQGYKSGSLCGHLASSAALPEKHRLLTLRFHHFG